MGFNNSLGMINNVECTCFEINPHVALLISESFELLNVRLLPVQSLKTLEILGSL